MCSIWTLWNAFWILTNLMFQKQCFVLYFTVDLTSFLARTFVGWLLISHLFVALFPLTNNWICIPTSLQKLERLLWFSTTLVSSQDSSSFTCSLSIIFLYNLMRYKFMKGLHWRWTPFNNRCTWWKYIIPTLSHMHMYRFSRCSRYDTI